MPPKPQDLVLKVINSIEKLKDETPIIPGISVLLKEILDTRIGVDAVKSGSVLYLVNCTKTASTIVQLEHCCQVSCHVFFRI